MVLGKAKELASFECQRPGIFLVEEKREEEGHWDKEGTSRNDDSLQFSIAFGKSFLPSRRS